MRRRLFHPVTSLVLLVALVADSWLIASSGQLFGASSTAGRFVRQHVLGKNNLICGWPGNPLARMFIRDRSGQTRTLVPEDESWDEATRTLRDAPRDVLMISYSPSCLSSGFWAPTTCTDRHILKVQFGENFSAEERAVARRQYVERCGAAAWLSHADFQTLTTADIDRTRPILLGYLHNTLAAAALILFLLSLRWLPKTPAYLRAHLAARRLSRGLCPRCSYTLHGLREPRCPECGQEIKLKAKSEKLKSESEGS